MKRGEVWWANLDPTQGSEIRKTRPVVVLTIDSVNRARRTAVVVPLTSSPDPRPPIRVAVPSAGPDSVAACDQVRAVDKQRLTTQHGRLAPADMKAVENGLRTILGL